MCFALEILFGSFILNTISNRNRLNCHLNGEVRKTFILFNTEKENLEKQWTLQQEESSRFPTWHVTSGDELNW